MLIGESIQDAIDWTQDRLHTTRPLAENTLFSLLADRMVRETDQGFVLTDSEDEVEKHHLRSRSKSNRNYRRFQTKRKLNPRKKMIHLDNCDAADDMIDGDE